jgi:hypothetical protein
MVFKEKYIMAIYPYTNTYVINKDAVAGSQFKAGMVLMMNADGKAVPADSQLLVFNYLGQKLAKILGLAAGDSNLTGNTIIVPDTVGNNYLDENKNFVNASNAEYVAIKRQLLDYADETINEYYNMNFSPIPKRRGIGVYSLTGNTFATDQFNAVLHGDYGVDSTDTISFSPGDLLTFGGGVNAGKLVKINTNSFGPDVVVVGIVEKYNSNMGLLYFRYILDNVSFGTASSTVLALDAGLTASYPSSGTAWYDLSGNSRNFTLTNGPVYSPSNSGFISFDGTDDFASLNYTITSNTITVLVWYNSRSFSSASVVDGLISNYEPSAQGFDIRKLGTGLHISQAMFPSGFIDLYLTNSVVDNTWYNIAFTFDGNTLITYTNGSSVASGNSTATRQDGTKIVIGTSAYDVFARTLSCFVSEVRILNQALTATQITNYYNATKSRYGL